MKRICTICARGGSKGVPGKNLRPLQGRPLLAHSIEQALASNLFEEVGVSSDCGEILAVAAAFGATYLVRRPADLATDQSAKLPAIQHCVRTIEQRTTLRFDIMVDLDATAPLRTIEDIRGAVALQESSPECSNVITGCLAHRSPYFNLVEATPDGYVRLSKPGTGIVRRQDSPVCYDCNASIYVWPRRTFFTSASVIEPNTRLYEMPRERSVDIDTAFDFELIEFLLARRQGGRP